MKQKCKIVMYHYVRPIRNSRYSKIKGLEVDGFKRQIKYFKERFNFVSVDQILNSIYNENPIPENSILLTFDDGFKDHYLHVFPILKQFNISGLFFPAAKAIEEQSVLDVHKIHFILESCKNEQNIIKEIYDLVNQEKSSYELESAESYFKRVAIPNKFDNKEIIFIKRMLQKELPQKLRNYFVNYLFEKFVNNNEKSISSELYLSLDEINEMKNSGMNFGLHGYSHEWLNHLNENELEIEIHGCLEFNSKINGKEDPLLMCYPYGGYSDLVLLRLKRNNFKAAFTTDVGDAELSPSNAFLLKRYDTNDFPR